MKTPLPVTFFAAMYLTIGIALMIHGITTIQTLQEMQDLPLENMPVSLPDTGGYMVVKDSAIISTLITLITVLTPIISITFIAVGWGLLKLKKWAWKTALLITTLSLIATSSQGIIAAAINLLLLNYLIRIKKIFQEKPGIIQEA